MSLWTDRDLLRYGPLVISPFLETSVHHGVISYGLSSAGYDIRLGETFRIFTNTWGGIVDPKAMPEAALVTHQGPSCLIPPNAFALGCSLERFTIPEDVLGICLGKSTYARCGIIVNITPLEPGWQGILTIEISNTTPLPAKVYAKEGIAQVLFIQLSQPPRRSYTARAGKYQGQTGIVLPR